MPEPMTDQGMITADELRATIRDGKLTPEESRRLLQVLAEIAFRLWYDKLDAEKASDA